MQPTFSVVQVAKTNFLELQPLAAKNRSTSTGSKILFTRSQDLSILWLINYPLLGIS